MVTCDRCIRNVISWSTFCAVVFFLLCNCVVLFCNFINSFTCISDNFNEIGSTANGKYRVNNTFPPNSVELSVVTFQDKQHFMLFWNGIDSQLTDEYIDYSSCILEQSNSSNACNGWDIFAMIYDYDLLPVLSNFIHINHERPSESQVNPIGKSMYIATNEEYLKLWVVCWTSVTIRSDDFRNREYCAVGNYSKIILGDVQISERKTFNPSISSYTLLWELYKGGYYQQAVALSCDLVPIYDPRNMKGEWFFVVCGLCARCNFFLTLDC